MNRPIFRLNEEHFTEGLNGVVTFAVIGISFGSFTAIA